MKNIISLLFIFIGLQAYAAASPNFTNLAQDDFDKISKEFSANFTHSSVMGAATLGKLFGIEAGLVGGTTPSPETDAIIKQNSPGSELSTMYHAGLLLAVSVPFGLTGELVMIPATTSGSASFQTTSLGLKWTLNETFVILPVNLAFRGIYSTSKFNFDQVISGVNSTVSDENKVTGLQILLSPKLPIVEPYVGIGFLKATNTLSVTGTTSTIFTYTTSQSAESSPSTTQILAGVNARLLLFSLGLEYSKAFDATSLTAKLGFSF